ncbi:MAG: VWA domain-containing protein [Piscinibacter sp.]|uniref:nitric oxide reductase activation protein NorD n=1 Tax=Piscinibacter sp. TaxID=1903157 RepID=UPI00258DCC2D|nr:VWA domain-containing protein [Piscinibacter sp.]MCW5664737.1 VWA domain-containing protein [Piscinibacter sp.]
MEEWVGQWWHRAISRAAERSFPEAAVTQAQVQRAIRLLFRAAGGDPSLRVAEATLQRHGGARRWLERVAGSGQRAATATLDAQALALPERIAVFSDAALNRDLYLWLAAAAAVFEPRGDWVADNLRAGAAVVERFPGLAARRRALVEATLQQRPGLQRLHGRARAAEAAVQAALLALRDGVVLDVAAGIVPAEVAPVWPWLWSVAPGADAAAPGREPAPREDGARSAPRDARRRRAQRVTEAADRNAMLMFFRAESIMTWSEFVKVNRGSDDEPGDDPSAAADDMETLAVADGGATCAARVRFDLDLPSASADDRPLGEGIRLPEWDWKARTLRPEHCALQVFKAAAPAPYGPPPGLRRLARRVRRRMETLRAAPRWQRGCTDGDELDLDAWVRHAAEAPDESPPVLARRVDDEHSLATLLLADLSLSTEAHVPGTEQRVIDVIREALYVFGEALEASGDPFAMLGFSSVKREHVRIQRLKDFGDAWDGAAMARVGAVRPGFYTRMGAALRHATAQLAQRPERQRLLLLLTDGKPNDLDVYEGRYGLEDTRHAVQEARAAGLVPFAVTVDEAGHDWLPHLFGARSYALVHRPAQLARRLAQIVATLSRG